MTQATSTRKALPMQLRAASFAPATYSEADNTVELVWSTGAAVRRFDWWKDEYYNETLSLDPAHVQLDRLNQGAPLLASHDAHNLEGVIGVVERAWIVAGEGRALVRFSSREDVQPIVADVRAGILRNISVGYSVRKYEIIVADGQLTEYRAIDWEPAEISLVSVPADAGAGIRSGAPAPSGAQRPTTECEFVNRAPAHHHERAAMPENQTVQAATNNAAPFPSADVNSMVNVDQLRAEATTLERTRVQEINTLCARHKLPDLATSLIAQGATVDAARAAVLNKLATDDAASTTMPRIETVRDQGDVVRAGVENALLHRAAPSRHQLNDAGRQFRAMSLLEIGRDLLERSGQSTRGLGKMELAQRAMHGTSDFPAILANIANNTLRTAYEAAPQTFRPFCRQSTAPDFKQIQRTQVGDAPSLQKVNEHAEFSYGTTGEGKEVYQLATYGRIIPITRQVIINDDLGAFTDIPAKFGRAAADLESDIVWGILTGNAAMGDGTALFHADHGNLAGAAAALDIAPLGLGRTAMRKQTSIDGRQINIMPRYLLVPAALETKAQQYTSSAYVSAKSGDINPFAGALTPLVEPRLDAVSATAWYLAADPGQIDTIEYSYLDGNQGVYIETRNGFEVDGVEVKARLDFAAKAIDWRGLFKNAGA